MKITTEPFDPADYITDADSVSTYLQDAIEDDDPRSLPHALQDVMRAIGGIDVLAAKTQLSATDLERAITSESVDVQTLKRITKALGATVTLPGTALSEPAAA